MIKLPAALWKISAGVYFALLTVVLVVPNPWSMLGQKETSDSRWHWSLRWLKNDKVQHCLVYGLGAALLLAAGWGLPSVLAGVAVHGAAIEMAQHWFPPRSTDLWDWVADVVGGLVGCALCYRFPGRGP